VVALAREITSAESLTSMPTSADRTSLLLMLPVLAGVLVLGSCAGAPGVRTVTVTPART
jgi:hypothetical protein